jgi:hypothetical protein
MALESSVAIKELALYYLVRFLNYESIVTIVRGL